MNRRIGIVGLVASASSAIAMLLLSLPLDRTFWLAIIWVAGAAISFIMGLTQTKSSRRLRVFCMLGGAVMLLFAAMLLPAFRRAEGYAQQTVTNSGYSRPNKPLHRAGADLCILLATSRPDANMIFERPSPAPFGDRHR